MARIRGHAALNEDKTLYVHRGTVDRPMVVDGRSFKVGDEFPWRELQGVTPRLLRLLHDQRRIGHERPEDPAKGAEPPPGTREEKVAARAPAANQAPSGANGKRQAGLQARG